MESSGGGTTGKVLKTTDGGATWTELAVPGGGSMQGIGFITPDIGWTSGRGASMRTLDGGQTWTPEAGIDGSVNRFEFFGDTLAYAMGHEVFVLHRSTSTAGEPAPTPAPLALDVFPNPASGTASFRYTLTAPGEVRLSVFDVLGREVEVLDAGEQRAGDHTVGWSAGAHPPGLYLARLVSGNEVATARVVIAHDR